MTPQGYAPDDLDAMAAAYRRDGYAVLRGLFDRAFLDALLAECEDLQGAARRGELPPEHGTAIFNDDAVAAPIVHYLSHLTAISPLARQAADHPAIRSAMDLVVGPGCTRVDDERLGIVYQDARPGRESAYTRIGWHSDWQGSPHLDIWPAAAFTLHLDGTSPANGFLRVVPGSHLWATPAPAADVYGNPGPVGTDVTGGRTTAPPPQPMPLGFEFVPGEVAVYCLPGDVLLHDCYLWHSAARATDDEALRRHIRGSYYARVPARDLQRADFVKNARR